MEVTMPNTSYVDYLLSKIFIAEFSLKQLLLYLFLGSGIFIETCYFTDSQNLKFLFV